MSVSSRIWSTRKSWLKRMMIRSLNVKKRAEWCAATKFSGKTKTSRSPGHLKDALSLERQGQKRVTSAEDTAHIYIINANTNSYT